MNKVILLLIFSILTTTSMAQKKIKQTAGRDQLGTFAPKFAELNDDILFGEVWSRTEQLSLRDRSLVTITSLISQGITDSSLTFHLQSAKKQRYYAYGNCRDHHSYRLLCRMAESMGGIPSCQRSME